MRFCLKTLAPIAAIAIGAYAVAVWGNVDVKVNTAVTVKVGK